MDDYMRGLLAGLLIGEGSFSVSKRSGSHLSALRVQVKLHMRSERLLREIQAATGLGAIYGPYYHQRRQYLVWYITRLEELADLCRLLDADDFASRCDWVGLRYRRMREELRCRITWEFPTADAWRGSPDAAASERPSRPGASSTLQ